MQPEVTEFLRLDPRLAAIEREVEAIRDDGSRAWFCSNFLWLPLNTRLRLLIGVARLPDPELLDAPELYASGAYERMFEHLSRKLPPCRGCGCRRFEPYRSAAQA